MWDPPADDLLGGGGGEEEKGQKEERTRNIFIFLHRVMHLVPSPLSEV